MSREMAKAMRLWWLNTAMIAWMGLGSGMGRDPMVDVGLLVFICCLVITSGLNGLTPVFLKAEQIVASVKALGKPSQTPQ